MNKDYEVIDNQAERMKPLFNSTEEYKEALEVFYDKLKPEFKKLDIARRKSIELAMQKVYF